MFSSRFELMVPTQSAGADGQLLPMPSSSADTQEPMSPTTGATISTLESISLGSISIWMNFFGASPQVLPLPCDNSQLRRAPIRHTTAAAFKPAEPGASAHFGGVSELTTLAMLNGGAGSA